MYWLFLKEKNKKGHKFKVSDHARISKDKNIFAEGYVSSWIKEVFAIKKVTNAVLIIQKVFIVEKVMSKRYNKLYVEWKSFNSSINNLLIIGLTKKE